MNLTSRICQDPASFVCIFSPTLALSPSCLRWELADKCIELSRIEGIRKRTSLTVTVVRVRVAAEDAY